MHRYLWAGTAYGVARKAIELSVSAPQVTIERIKVKNAEGWHEYRSRMRPMLVTEKVAVVAAHACISALYSPYFVAVDLVRAEARLRGIDIDPAKNTAEDAQDAQLYHYLL